MEKLMEIKSIRSEIIDMDFSYKNVHRLMFLIYETKSKLESSNIIPNKEIALHQTNKLIQHELLELILSDTESEIKITFQNLHDNFKLVLSYFA